MSLKRYVPWTVIVILSSFLSDWPQNFVRFCENLARPLSHCSFVCLHLKKIKSTQNQKWKFRSISRIVSIGNISRKLGKVASISRYVIKVKISLQTEHGIWTKFLLWDDFFYNGTRNKKRLRENKDCGKFFN